ncbi:MAG: DUF4065 domain-containing protein [Clostridiales bacterium]|jgi:uncharacterized phage-associated protein|nr:DUF4065 domain-containing protein [Clostridiales bacterium]
MATIFDVAKYILERKGEMTTWKLQKLCYYAQAWSLAWDGKELFPDDFEAWRNGPVCPALYRLHQGMFTIEADQIPGGDSSVFDDDQRETLDVVIREYGDYDAYSLREQTHGELPWKQARGGLPPTANSNAIVSKCVIGEYYGSL